MNVTLIDGREVDSSSEEWRLECLARDRHVANMRRIARELRQDYLSNVCRREGDEAERRLRDASATAALTASAAANQAGATPECKTAAETSRVLNGVLQDLDSLTGRISSFANTVSRFADESYLASTTCERAYEVIR